MSDTMIPALAIPFWLLCRAKSRLVERMLRKP